MSDLISRQAAIDAMAELQGRASTKAELKAISKAWKRIKHLPSANIEPLTDNEQRIFLKALSREEEVCKKVDAEWGEGDEECEINLVHVCHEITRKVKGALWT